MSSRDIKFAYTENLNISSKKQDSEKLKSPFTVVSSGIAVLLRLNKVPPSLASSIAFLTASMFAALLAVLR